MLRRLKPKVKCINCLKTENEFTSFCIDASLLYQHLRYWFPFKILIQFHRPLTLTLTLALTPKSLPSLQPTNIHNRIHTTEYQVTKHTSYLPVQVQHLTHARPMKLTSTPTPTSTLTPIPTPTLAPSARRPYKPACRSPLTTAVAPCDVSNVRHHLSLTSQR